MIAVMQWSALALCSVVAVARIPGALRGHNRSIFGVFFLVAIAILLSIDGPYLAVDALLGGANYANLLLRFLVYGAIMLAGYRIAKAFGDDTGSRRVAGRAGLTVLTVVAIATAVFFLLADTKGSATGLTGLPARSTANAILINSYAAAGRAYPAYVAACLLPTTFHAVRGRFPTAIKTGAALLSTGFAGLIVGAVYAFVPTDPARLQAVFNFTAVLCLSLGLAVIWIAGLIARRRRGSEAGQLPGSGNWATTTRR